MDAGLHVSMGFAKQYTTWGEHTLQKLLASILLEESFVDDRAGKIVHHKEEHRCNLLLSVTSIVRNGFVL